jgi:hypothetical protein
MDLKKLRTGNSSNLSINSVSRQSSLESGASSPTGKASKRQKLSRLLPGRRSRRSSIQADNRNGSRDDTASSTLLPIPKVDPKDLNLADSGDEDLITLEDDDPLL